MSVVTGTLVGVDVDECRWNRPVAGAPGDDGPAHGALQSQLVQRRQGLPVGAQYVARTTRRKVESAHVQFAAGNDTQ